MGGPKTTPHRPQLVAFKLDQLGAPHECRPPAGRGIEGGSYTGTWHALKTARKVRRVTA